ncbi:type IV pilin protein [Candidatus Avelusimicrobium alvi]|uniref:type IV pilin protein n=1 Tax=Candidatus Avelusimicrobium alvi TaxID=3416221 RepID=UPI003D0D10B8
MQKSLGFTLIELLVVVLIIGILAAIAVPQYEKAVLKARFSEAIMATRTLKQAQDVYWMAQGTYTRDLSELDIVYPLAENPAYDNYIVGDNLICSVDEMLNYVNCQIRKTPYLGYSLGLLAKKNFCFADDNKRSICESLGGNSPENYREGAWRYTMP